MAKINLLPWREQRREECKRRFLIILAGVFVLGLFCVWLLDRQISVAMNVQASKNNYLRSEIVKLDAQISEVVELKVLRKQLLERMKTIQNLQGDRSIMAHLFDQFVRTLPEGVYYTELSMKNDVISIKGFAESNAQISALMRNLDGSDWLQSPNLTDVKASSVAGDDSNSFQLTVLATKPDAEKITNKNGKSP